MAGRILVQACDSEAQAAALVDGWIAGLVRDRARSAALQLDLSLVWDLGLVLSLGLCLGFPLDPGSVFAAGLPVGFARRGGLCGLARPGQQLLQPRRRVVAHGPRPRGIIFGVHRRMGLRWRPWLGWVPWWPGFSGVDGALVLAGDGAFGGFGAGLELAPPSGHRLRQVLWLWFAFRPGLPASCELGPGLPGCFPGGLGTGGPVLVSGVAGFERLPSGGQLRGEGPGAGRAGLVVPGLGVCGLPERVGFGLGGEPQLAADVGRGAGLGAFALEDARFDVAAVQAAEDAGFVAYLQRGHGGLPHVLQLGVAAVRAGRYGLLRVGDPGCFPVGGGCACPACVFLAQRGRGVGGQDAELAG